MPYASAIGIDLGTTYSCVSIWRNGHAETIANQKTGSRLTPSIVAFDDERLYVGQAAAAQAPMNPKNTVYEIKRIIGKRFNDRRLQADLPNLPYKVSSDPEENPVVEVDYLHAHYEIWPEQISAIVLGRLKQVAETHLNSEITDAVVTVPAYFSDAQRQATINAAKIAGLNVLRIINEPTSAVLAYGLHRNITEDRTVLVYDLGGGTFDISLVEIVNRRGSPPRYIVKAVGGDTNLGGTDFDKKLVDYCLGDIRTRHCIDLSDNARARIRLKQHCEATKRALSTTTKHALTVDGLLTHGRNYQCNISRIKFEQLCLELFDHAHQLVLKLFDDNDLPVDSVDDVVLIGGSTRIPRIKSDLANIFGAGKIKQTINPDEAVACGAAALAAIQSGDHSIDSIAISDVIPLSLGVSDVNKMMIPIIPANTRIPNKISQPSFTTVSDFQSSALISIYEGEFPFARDNLLLDSFRLNNIKVAKEGAARLAVTFAVDANGILTVMAEDSGSGNSNYIKVAERKGRLSPADICRMQEEMDTSFSLARLDIYDGNFSSSDEEEEEQQSSDDEDTEPTPEILAGAKDRLRDLCFRCKILFGSVSARDAISENERDAILKFADDALDWVDGSLSTAKDCYIKYRDFRRVVEPLKSRLAHGGH